MATVDRWFLAQPLPKLRKILSAHFGRPLVLRTMDGQGAASVFCVYGPKGDPIAVVKVINWRRERRTRHANKPSSDFRFYPGRERLSREFEILGKLAPHGLTPHPLFLAQKFAVHEYYPGPLLVERLRKEPQGAFEAGWKALRRLHDLGVCHGDPNPRNVIDGAEGLKFIDFEHSLNEERYDFDHMMAYDYLRYCRHSRRLSTNLDETIFGRYLLEGEGELSGPVEGAITNLIGSFPLDRSFLAFLKDSALP